MHNPARFLSTRMMQEEWCNKLLYLLPLQRPQHQVGLFTLEEKKNNKFDEWRGVKISKKTSNKKKCMRLNLREDAVKDNASF